MVPDAPTSESTATPARSPLRWLRPVVGLAVFAGVAWYFRALRPAVLWSVLRGASWPLVLVAAALSLVANTSARARRWGALLPTSPLTAQPPRLWELVRALLAGMAASNVLPFRAGEALRTMALRDRHAYPIKTLVAAQLLEKLVEVLTLATVGALLASAPDPFRRLIFAFLALGAAAGAAIFAVIVVARSGLDQGPGNGRVHRVLREAAGAVRALHDPRAWLTSYGWGLASDAVDVAMIGLCATAVSIHVGVGGWCAVLLAVNLATAVPSTPGQLGVHEAGAVLALASLSVDRDRALAFALLYHAVHVAPITLAGGVVIALAEPRSTLAAAPPDPTTRGRSPS